MAEYNPSVPPLIAPLSEHKPAARMSGITWRTGKCDRRLQCKILSAATWQTLYTFCLDSLSQWWGRLQWHCCFCPKIDTLHLFLKYEMMLCARNKIFPRLSVCCKWPDPVIWLLIYLAAVVIRKTTPMKARLTSKFKDDRGSGVRLWFWFPFGKKALLVTVSSTSLPIYILLNCLLVAPSGQKWKKKKPFSASRRCVNLTVVSLLFVSAPVLCARVCERVLGRIMTDQPWLCGRCKFFMFFFLFLIIWLAAHLWITFNPSSEASQRTRIWRDVLYV